MHAQWLIWPCYRICGYEFCQSCSSMRARAFDGWWCSQYYRHSCFVRLKRRPNLVATHGPILTWHFPRVRFLFVVFMGPGQRHQEGLAMAEGSPQLDVASVMVDVLQQQGKRLSDIDLASRKAEEAALRRYDAAGWLRKMVGVVAGKDLPAQPSEEEFRLGLRSGIILCNALNKVQPGAVPKVVEAPPDTIIIPDGAARSAFQYFENVRNFLDSLEEMGIPGFEASDLEQGGKSSRIVNCVLALRLYNEWKQGGGKGVWKFSGNIKPPSATNKQFVRRNSDLFINSLSRNLSTFDDKSVDSLENEQNSTCDAGQDINEMGCSRSLHMLIRELLSEKKQEDIPMIVENMLSKVMEEFEHRLASHNEKARTTPREAGFLSPSERRDYPVTEVLVVMKEQSASSNEESPSVMKEQSSSGSDELDGQAMKDQDLVEHQQTSIKVSNIINEEGWSDNVEMKERAMKHKNLVEHQQRSIQDLKNSLDSTREHMKMLSIEYEEKVKTLGKHLKSLAHAASGYQKVLEENRKLYNQVQDLKGNIRVYCRIRPFLPGQPSFLSAAEVVDEKTLTILTPAKHGKGKKSFSFNRVFGPSASQEEVFSDTQPLIRSVLDGYNVCIFAYGQTGSGKTHTMTGPKELTKESLGVNYRALSDLFLISEQRKDSMCYDVSVQMIEIYNEQVRDLLVTDGVNKKYPLEIRNNSPDGINVPHANLVPVSSTSEVISLMNIGNKNRAVGSTAMNDRSSRSHSCLTVHVQGRALTSSSTIRGCMHLVDLAGSERADKSEAVGGRLKEAQHINRSLSALGDVISALAQKSTHVPYRNSGQAKTLMFVHISPEPDALSETISTLKFAERVSTVELGAARANKESPDIKELKEQIANLKAALTQKERGELGSKQSGCISPDRVLIRSFGSSPSDSSWQSNGDVSKVERLSHSSATSRMQSDSFDSPPWPALSSPELINKEEKCIPSDWVDNVMSYDDKNAQHSPNMVNGTQNETAVADDIDDLENATSDTSELDYQWPLGLSKPNRVPNGLGSKPRKPSPKQINSPERRSLIPPPPSRRISNGARSPLPKHGWQAAPVDGKRKPTAVGSKSLLH
ncbi:P-loop nucleoside triphosphate hydrolases superfamily protein with CH (Calponin Homology) domain [Striga hermonthica]|uniref:P-loop nucleoside triphosphate hydrolases superfamily protein with CH (Calponin Homology) domain n=1 Tax=Striga hermonthica TaxID=68872 RepID=A0A9N7NHM6_STRHE|nr:P-loop nucleoside triphosphate hydrolases superfamily protein with CH (Calponin Homology) domain [Striga hermonthica]